MTDPNSVCPLVSQVEWLFLIRNVLIYSLVNQCSDICDLFWRT